MSSDAEKNTESKFAAEDGLAESQTSVSHQPHHHHHHGAVAHLQSTDTETFYGDSVGEAYRLKSELVAEHLALNGFGK